MDFTLEELYYLQDLNNSIYSESDFEWQDKDYQKKVIDIKLKLSKLILTKSNSEN